MNLYDNEKRLLDIDRIEMYVQIFEELEGDQNSMFCETLLDISTSFRNFYFELITKKHDVSQELLNYVENKFNKFIFIDNLEINKNHIYNDTQNVHDFVSPAVKIAKKIIQEHPSQYKRLFEHVFFDTIENITIENFGIQGTDLFASIYSFIINHKYKNEMLKRLFEEINESVGTCSSGHITRMINSLKGFESEYDVNIDEYEIEKAKFFHKINKNINIFDIFSINNFENLINSDKINLPKDSTLALRLLKDYSKVNWYFYEQNEKKIFKYK